MHPHNPSPLAGGTPMAEFDVAHPPRLPKPPGAGAIADDDGSPPRPLPKPPGHAHRPTNPHPIPDHHIIIFPEPIKPAANKYNNKKKKKKKKAATPKRRSCCCFCCIWFLVALFVILAFVALSSALTYAWLHPKPPEFRVEKLGATRFDVSQKQGHAAIDAGFDMVITVRNRNDAVGLEHRGMKVGVYAGDDVRLGKGSAPGFRQGENNMTVVAVKAGVAGAAVDGAAGNALERRYKSKTLELDVVVETEERAVVGNWLSPWIPVKVVCANVKLSEGKGGPVARCGIRLFRW